MTKTEIRKALYKEKPEAHLQRIRMGNAYYTAILDGDVVITFCVPVEEMGDTDFLTVMDGKLLQRWVEDE